MAVLYELSNKERWSWPFDFNMNEVNKTFSAYFSYNGNLNSVLDRFHLHPAFRGAGLSPFFWKFFNIWPIVMKIHICM